MTNLITWCLAGALAASLAWNFRDLTRSAESPAACAPTSCAQAGCRDALAGLDLTPEQRQALTKSDSNACNVSVSLDEQAMQRSNELFGLLSRPDLDQAKAYALADEVSSLRARSLRNCVDSILEVRRHLKPDQVETLLENCGHPAPH